MNVARFNDFAALHRRENPLVLVNMWDVGSARTLAAAGAPAVATGSDSVAAAMGLSDGEAVPFARLLSLAGDICAAVDVPVSVDMEAGYGADPADVAANAAALQDVGVIGINLEDTEIASGMIYDAQTQAARIAAVRARVGSAFFINARCDVFLRSAADQHASRVDDALARAAAYAEAGASGFFVPGVGELDLIGAISAGTDLPVNAMATPGGPDTGALTRAGVSRISHGPFPYRGMMEHLRQWWDGAQL